MLGANMKKRSFKIMVTDKVVNNIMLTIFRQCIIIKERTMDGVCYPLDCTIVCTICRRKVCRFKNFSYLCTRQVDR